MRLAFYTCLALWLLLVWAFIAFTVLYALTSPAYGNAAIVCGGGAVCFFFAAIAIGKWNANVRD